MVKTVGQSAVSGLPLITAIPSAGYFDDSSDTNNGSSSSRGPAAPSLVLLDSSRNKAGGHPPLMATGSYNEAGEDATAIA